MIQRRWNDGEFFGQCTTLLDVNTVENVYVTPELFNKLPLPLEVFLAIGHVYCKQKWLFLEDIDIHKFNEQFLMDSSALWHVFLSSPHRTL
jgi:hypothetical protein